MDHLAREALNAKRMGLSYGQYKALKYNPVAIAPPEPERGENTYKCKTCGKEFFSWRLRKYCSTSCRTLSYYKPVEPTERNCIHCGKPFMAYGKRNTICSDACRTARYRNRVKEAVRKNREQKTMGE